MEKIRGRENFTLRNIDLDIADKDFCVILGPSGCGKSTLIRMIAGLNSITEGTLYFDDKIMNKVEPKDRDIAMVFQSYALYPHMTVYDNMAFSLNMKNESKEVIDKRVKMLLTSYNLKTIYTTGHQIYLAVKDKGWP